MKGNKELKLNSLSISNLKEHEMSKIYGGNYCALSVENQRYNEYYGFCTCICFDSGTGQDYYSCRNTDEVPMSYL